MSRRKRSPEIRGSGESRAVDLLCRPTYDSGEAFSNGERTSTCIKTRRGQRGGRLRRLSAHERNLD